MNVLEFNATPANEILLRIFFYTKKLEYAFLSQGDFKNLSLSEIHIISKIGEIKRATISGLAKAMGVTVSTMTTNANRLFSKGYIKKNRSDSDRRIVYVSLTDTGEKACSAHDEFHKNIMQKAIEALNPQDRNVFSSCLEGILDFFSSENTWDL